MGFVNVQTGRNKTVQLLGLKELQQQINALGNAAKPAAQQISVEAGKSLLNQLEGGARSAGVPTLAIQDLFLYTRQKGGDPDSVTVLVGLKKRGTHAKAHGYKEWHASDQIGRYGKKTRVRKKKELAVKGRLIGENLGTMWELGTTKMKPKPWFRRTLVGARDAIFNEMAAGYKRILGLP